MSTRRSYTAAEKAEALALYEAEGPTAVQTQLGISKGTVAGWARTNGVRTVRNERTAAATEARSVDMAARRSALVEKLLEVAELGIDLEVEILRGRDAALRDVVGARTRAIHDLQLLTGEATGRTEHADPRERLGDVRDELAARRAQVA